MRKSLLFDDHPFCNALFVTTTFMFHRNRKVSISYKNENYLPSEPEISELKVYVGE